MPEWLDHTLNVVREAVDAIPWSGIRDHPIWSSIAENAVSPQGIALIVTITAALVLGGFFGFFWGRRGGVPTIDRTRDEKLLPEKSDEDRRAPEGALREHLVGQGLSGRALERRLRAFDASLNAARSTMNALNAEDPEAKPLIEAAKRSLEEGDFETTIAQLTSAQNRFVSTRKIMEDAAQRRQKAASSAAVLAGDLEMARRNYGAAAEHFAAAIEIVGGRAENKTAQLLTKQATAAFRAGDRRNAASLFETATKLTQRTSGREHPDTAKALNRLALVRFALGQHDVAEKLYWRAIAIDEKALGPDHATVATDLNNLVQVLTRQGKFDSAEPLLRRVIEIRQKALGPNHKTIRQLRRNYLDLIQALRNPGEAKRISGPKSRAGDKTDIAAE